MFTEEEAKKPTRIRFQRHANVLIWKCYLQRQRRWPILLAETTFSFILLLISVFIAKPVFLLSLQTEPEPPLASADLLASLNSQNLLGYAPNNSPYTDIMSRAAGLLQTEIIGAETEQDLNNHLYNLSMGTPLTNPVIWIIFKPKDGNMWKFSIRSTERAKYATSTETTSQSNPHLRAGFLGVQLAVSQAILEYASPTPTNYELSLVSMPVSPLMQESQVRRAISGILLCFTIALIPPIVETQALVVGETHSRFKRSLRMRNVDFATVYIAWLVYAYLTAIPICLLGSFTLMLIFRWIHILFALVILLAYVSVMIMLALIMAMFHSKAWIACLWSVLFTLLQTFLAELLVHHQYDQMHAVLTFLLHVIFPPLGLVHALNEFALLQTGRGAFRTPKHSLFFTILLWTVMNLFYFALLMMLQRTMRDRAIGGQVSWKSIIFKKVEDTKKLNRIQIPTGKERDKLQAVDDLIAKAISFRNVSKSVMNVPLLNNITLDIYRGEFTMLFAERIQETMMKTIEDLLTGLTQPDDGSINVLGQTMSSDTYFMAMPSMMGYCHRCSSLVSDLTVEEHIILYADICLWQESKQYLSEFTHIRQQRLLVECSLESVRHEYIRNLDLFYRAQLCWAIALLMEPRVIFIPNFIDEPLYVRVIRDKIMKYKKFVTIVQLCYTSIQLEYADRVFIFDNKVLAFGGTPAFMFFKYGREYRVRMTFRQSNYTDDNKNIAELLERATTAGATIRAHLGSLLILRLPASPTEKVAALVKELDEKANVYGITSLSISLPDSEEVSRRAIYESRAAVHETSPYHHNLTREALKNISGPCEWKRKDTRFINFTHLRIMGWKFVSFYLYNKTLFVVTIVAAILAGLFIGISFSSILAHLDKDHDSKKILHGEVLTVEALEQSTTLVLRSDFSDFAKSVANAYVLSETKATPKEIEDMVYTALSHTESLTEYLVTRAIDSPQQYVYMYAYGMDVATEKGGKMTVQALYSPIHHDQGAAARSLARVHMALLRHYTQALDATIQVTDDPLALDLTPWMKYAGKPPLLIQFLLILTISHITLIPSAEHGMVRHLQCQALNFSPARYWFSLYICDITLYWLLVVIMCLMSVTIIHLAVPIDHFNYADLVIIPITLIIYGMACVPQAYLFSIGPQAALNTMSFVIVNVVFGETTVIAKLFYGSALSYALYFMRLSPQFNMAYAYVKIKQIFLYNSECALFKSKKLCSSKILHKCCEKCGVLQACFKPKSYFTWMPGILTELVSMIGTATLFMTLLLLWEHRLIQRFQRFMRSWFISVGQLQEPMLAEGTRRERADVLDKLAQIKRKQSEKVVTYGEYLLSVNLTKKEAGMYILRNVYFGLGKGEVLALSGLKRHGRLKLCEILCGYKIPNSGNMFCMSKWQLKSQPYMYSRNVSISCERQPLSHWMRVNDALVLVAVLRGVPRKHINTEIQNYIDALELHDQANMRIADLLPNEKTRLHFAAAVIGAPPILVLDECTAYQKYSIRRAMYYILYTLKKRGHAIFISSSNVESHMPITNRLAILVDGYIYDMDQVDALVERYSKKGYTVVVHLKDEVEVTTMFAQYFRNFIINDMSEVLVNIQVFDIELSWAAIFEKMELLKSENPQVYSYIVSAIPIDYIYNSIIINERGLKPTNELVSLFCLKNTFSRQPKKRPKQEEIEILSPFEKKYDITKLKELPWSVIFQR